jgi:hypothetical protein
MSRSVKGSPLGPSTRDPFSRQRAASGMSAVTTTSPAGLPGDPVVRGAEAGLHDQAHQRIGRHA